MRFLRIERATVILTSVGFQVQRCGGLATKVGLLLAALQLCNFLFLCLRIILSSSLTILVWIAWLKTAVAGRNWNFSKIIIGLPLPNQQSLVLSRLPLGEIQRINKQRIELTRKPALPDSIFWVTGWKGTDTGCNRRKGKHLACNWLSHWRNWPRRY